MEIIINNEGEIFSVDTLVSNGKGLKGKVVYVNQDAHSMEVLINYNNGELSEPYKLHLDIIEIDDWVTID